MQNSSLKFRYLQIWPYLNCALQFWSSILVFCNFCPKKPICRNWTGFGQILSLKRFVVIRWWGSWCNHSHARGKYHFVGTNPGWYTNPTRNQPNRLSLIEYVVQTSKKSSVWIFECPYYMNGHNCTTKAVYCAIYMTFLYTIHGHTLLSWTFTLSSLVFLGNLPSIFIFTLVLIMPNETMHPHIYVSMFISPLINENGIKLGIRLVSIGGRWY